LSRIGQTSNLTELLRSTGLLSCGQNPEIGRLPASELDHANNKSEDLSNDGRDQ